MTEDKKRARRDMVRELGESVLEALTENVCAGIATGAIPLPDLQESLKPHMQEAAKRIASSEEFQQAMMRRMNHDLFESARPAQRPSVGAPPHQPPHKEPSALQAAGEAMVGDRELIVCPADDCQKVGEEAIKVCGRKHCPFPREDDLHAAD